MTAISLTFKEPTEIEVRDFWKIDDKAGSHLLLGKMLEEWESLFPLWMHAEPEVAYTTIGGKIRLVSCQEMHILQYLARLQTAVAATTVAGHPYQYYLCGLVYTLGSFIETKNRMIEQSRGLSIQTPLKYR